MSDRSGSRESEPAAGVPDPTETGPTQSGPSRQAASTVVPPFYRRNYYLGVAITAGLGLLAATAARSGFSQGLLVTWSVYAIAGLGFYLVFGLSGQFAFSQGAFVGIGAYSSAWASRSLGFAGGFVTAVCISAVLAVILGFVIRRSNSFYFAIATLAFGSLAAVLFRELEWFTGPSGEVVNIARPELFGYVFATDYSVFLLALAVLTVGLLLVALLQRSALHRAVIAVRDNEPVAAAAGLPTLRIRLTFFAVGSAFAGAAGSLLAHRTGFLSPDAFSLELGIDLFLLLLLGGMGSMWGPLLGAAFVVWAPEQLRFVGASQGLVYGILLVLVVLALPEGLIGIFEKVRSAAGSRRGGTDADGAGPGGSMDSQLPPGTDGRHDVAGVDT